MNQMNHNGGISNRMIRKGNIYSNTTMYWAWIWQQPVEVLQTGWKTWAHSHDLTNKISL